MLTFREAKVSKQQQTTSDAPTGAICGSLSTNTNAQATACKFKVRQDKTEQDRKEQDKTEEVSTRLLARIENLFCFRLNLTFI